MNQTKLDAWITQLIIYDSANKSKDYVLRNECVILTTYEIVFKASWLRGVKP